MSNPTQLKRPNLAVLLVLLCATLSSAALPLVDHQVSGTAPICPLNNFCFVYDHSGSIDSNEFQLEVDFIEAISIAVSMITPNIRFSAAAFSSNGQLVQSSTPDLNGTFLPTLNSFGQLGGGTNIGSGMRICLDEIRDMEGSRAMIVLTDGQDSSSSQAPMIAEEARNESVAVATIGILPSVNTAYLEGLATRPEFYSEAQFSQLPSIIDRVVNITCELATMFSCQVNDVCFAIDSSSSVDDTEFAQQQDFVREIATIIDSRNSSTTFSAHTFDEDVTTVLPVGTMQSLSGFIPLLDSLTPSRGSTNMFAGLRSCFEDLNNRTGNRVIVLVTDGRDNNIPRAIRGRPAVVDAGIGILTVGIGSRANLQYLDRLGTVPGSVVNSSSFNTLPSTVDLVTNEVCDMASNSNSTPVNACEEQFQRCLLTFRGSNTLQSFDLRRGARFTPYIIYKFGSQFPGRWRRVKSYMVNDDGTRTRLRGRPFNLSQRKGFYGVRLNLASLSDVERLSGKCILLNVTLRHRSSSDSQCVVFRAQTP